MFPGGGGETEGPEAFAEAIRSAERHLLSLPGETRVSPGHGDDTLVEREVPQLDEWKARGWGTGPPVTRGVGLSPPDPRSTGGLGLSPPGPPAAAGGPRWWPSPW